MLHEKLKKYIPDREQLLKNRSLRVFGSILYDDCLWHLNRNSVARAAIVGLFFAWVPIPFQMVFSAAFAIVFQAYVPLAVALVWITNPITMPLLFYFAYRIGTVILNVEVYSISFDSSVLVDLLSNTDVWHAFLLGCLTCGVISAFSGYLLIHFIWKYFNLSKYE